VGDRHIDLFFCAGARAGLKVEFIKLFNQKVVIIIGINHLNIDNYNVFCYRNTRSHKSRNVRVSGGLHCDTVAYL